ncbi:type VI secretion system transmembrane protein TssO [Chitinophaga nivalis]|uniref:Type VI secretion system transmembrane protein TssO n=1 Tax=Chitinophaga nivalis TaxID=2991709 RepID=A0ABT3IR81_9BACT|nr:type VI secretion system transmembrane protein TssO [Chitinophaga nivalis]MCW3463844.1 type VI secretion system transmembrane protein TssO [Chitinophaga nivalis]MCW3486466.1 type VI secretion system transmembrane protein TssO [Chitinophaga nivalis]
MQALNSRERTVAFLWFLVFFMMTTGLLLLAVFFNYQVPINENKLLRRNLFTHQQEKTFQEQFVQQLGKVKQLLDTLQLPGQQAVYADQVVARLLAEMRNSIPKDKVAAYGLYDDIIQQCLSLLQCKQQLRELQQVQESMAALKEQITDLNTRLEARGRDLDNCRQMLLLNSRIP